MWEGGLRTKLDYFHNPLTEFLGSRIIEANSVVSSNVIMVVHIFIDAAIRGINEYLSCFLLLGEHKWSNFTSCVPVGVVQYYSVVGDTELQAGFQWLQKKVYYVKCFLRKTNEIMEVADNYCYHNEQ